jgi:hypothetical protein
MGIPGSLAFAEEMLAESRRVALAAHLTDILQATNRLLAAAAGTARALLPDSRVK